MPQVDSCLICYSKTHPLVSTPCNHNEICAICYARLRALDESIECPICKASNEQIVVASGSRTPLPFEEYHIWGDQLGDDYMYHEPSGMFYPKAYYESTIKSLFQFNCHLCEENKEFASYRSLQDHLRVEHRLSLCDLCVDNKRDFVARLPRYSPAGLQKHRNHPTHGHAKCKFCKPMFYDVSALYHHLRDEHYQCHLCQAHFLNYDQLHRHFEGYHFSCRDPACIAARFVAFDSEIKLILHQREVHGATTTPSISLNFKTSRSRTNEGDNENHDSGADPNGFIPPSMRRRQENEGNEADGLHPQHVQRTEELRQQAALLREQESDVSEAVFPALGEAAAGGGGADRFSVGWTDSLAARPRSTVGAVTDEAFPSLPASAAPKRRPMTQYPHQRQRNNANWSQQQQQKKTTNWSQQQQNKPKNTNNWKSAQSPSQVASGVGIGMAGSQAGSSQAENFPALVSSGWVKPKSAIQQSSKAPVMSKDNFPSLGAGSKKPATSRYAAAESLAKKLQGAPAVHQNNFFKPPVVAQPKAPAPPKKAPNTESPDHFPSLKSGGNPGSLDNIKAELGISDYKALKALTKEYSAGALAPEAYVDRAYALLNGARSFYKFVPALVASCPTVNPMAAQNYIRELRVQSNGGGGVPKVD